MKKNFLSFVAIMMPFVFSASLFAQAPKQTTAEGITVEIEKLTILMVTSQLFLLQQSVSLSLL